MGNFRENYLNQLEPYGNDIGDAFTSNTDVFMESAFTASPTYRLMKVKSTEYKNLETIDGRTIEVERMGSLREILFRPLSDGLNVGTYLEFDNDTWLIYDKFGRNKVSASRCNRILKWYDKNGVYQEIDCIASASDLGSKSKQSKNEIEWNKFDVRLPLGQLFVFVELTDETSEIGLNDRFVFGKKVYEVVGMDDTTSVNKNGHGLIQFTIKVTTVREEDDFANGIANNVYKDSVVVTPSEEVFVEPPKEDSDKGGLIW